MSTILFIEDDRFLLNAYKAAFEKEGYQVLLAPDANKGYEFLEQQIPDLIILDLILPIKDGFTVLKELKANDKFKDIPVIITSNLGEAADVQRCMKLGASDYVVKTNVNLHELVEKIGYFIKAKS